jgi:hypothetical protein
MSPMGHVWTAPWQELSDVAAALVGCGHVFGLFVRPVWPLALMLCADLGHGKPTLIRVLKSFCESDPISNPIRLLMFVG